MHETVALNLLEELRAMIVYTADNGDPLPAGIMPCVHNLERKLANPRNPEVGPITPDELQELSTWHGQLASLVAPATPHTIHLMQQPASGAFKFLGPIGLVKQLSLLSMFFLASTVLLALSDNVNSATIDQGIFRSSGLVLLLNLLFLLTCAGLGATFAALHQLFGYINTSTYHPKYDATYWIKIMMGLISGLMLSELIPINEIGANVDSQFHDLGKPLIALLGGFSADLPYRILSRLLEIVEQMFGKTLTKPPTGKSAVNIAALGQSGVSRTTSSQQYHAGDMKDDLIQVAQGTLAETENVVKKGVVKENGSNADVAQVTQKELNQARVPKAVPVEKTE